MAVKIPKKEAPRFLLVFLVIFVIFMIILGIMLGGGGEPEAPYSSDMESGDNAYVDITYCKPKYAMGTKGKPGLGTTDIVCEVQTTDNGTMLMAFPEYYYVQGTRNFEGGTVVDRVSFFSLEAFSSSSYPILSFDTPYRIHCEKYDLLDEEGEKVVLEMNYNNEEG